MRTCKCGVPTGSKSTTCRDCHKTYMKEWRKKKREEGKPLHELYNYEWRKKNPEKYLLQCAKGRAKKKDWEFNITEEDIKIPIYCPVLGFKLELVYNQGSKDNKPSIARIDSSKGYIKGNIQVISWRANNIKGDGSLEEFEKLVEFMKYGEQAQL